MTIKNVTLKDANVSSSYTISQAPWGSYAGALIGSPYSSFPASLIYIDNCHVTGTSSVTGKEYAGGLVGDANYCFITRCSSVADVNTTTNSSSSGGLVGNASNSSIYACYATGKVAVAGGDYAPGGIVGYFGVSGNISGCYYNGSALTKGTDTAGGRIAGKIYTASGKTTTLSYCGAPAISGLSFVGSSSGSGTLTYTQCNNVNENTTEGVEVSALYGIVANSANTNTFTVGGTTYNVKDCWTNNGSSAPTLKVKEDGTTN